MWGWTKPSNTVGPTLPAVYSSLKAKKKKKGCFELYSGFRTSMVPEGKIKIERVIIQVTWSRKSEV